MVRGLTAGAAGGGGCNGCGVPQIHGFTFAVTVYAGRHTQQKRGLQPGPGFFNLELLQYTLGGTLTKRVDCSPSPTLFSGGNWRGGQGNK
jgi:hypothetical protein